MHTLLASRTPHTRKLPALAVCALTYSKVLRLSPSVGHPHLPPQSGRHRSTQVRERDTDTDTLRETDTVAADGGTLQLHTHTDHSLIQVTQNPIKRCAVRAGGRLHTNRSSFYAASRHSHAQTNACPFLLRPTKPCHPISLSALSPSASKQKKVSKGPTAVFGAFSLTHPRACKGTAMESVAAR